MSIPPRSTEEPFVADFSEGFETGLYLALLELIDEGVLIASDEVILEANSAACRLLEREYRALVKQPLASLFGSERAFLETRQRLLIQGQMRGALTVALPGGRRTTLRYIAAARLLPGLHAIVLSPDWLMATPEGAPAPARNAPDIWPQLAAMLSQPLIVVDREHSISAANAAALKLLKRNRDTVIKQALSQFFHADNGVHGQHGRLEFCLLDDDTPLAVRQMPLADGGRLLLFDFPLLADRTLAAGVAANVAPEAVAHKPNAKEFAAVEAALEQAQLQVYFQPLVDTHNRTIVAGEALLRWHHPQRGLLPFGRFHELVQDEQAIARMCDWAMAEACRCAASWQNGYGPVQAPRLLTVNISVAQALREGFVNRVLWALTEASLSPQRLELDLDERILQADELVVDNLLQSLSALGVRLAVDDFGRNAFALSRLHRHRFHALKLDPDLVANIGHEESSEAIIEAFVAMADALRLQAFARGVTSSAQQAFLNALNCHWQQGPLYGPPLPASAFALLTVAPELESGSAAHRSRSDGQ